MILRAFALPLTLFFMLITGQGGTPGPYKTIEGNLAIIPWPMQITAMEGSCTVDENTIILSDDFSNLEFDPFKIFREVFQQKSGYALLFATGKSKAHKEQISIRVIRLDGNRKEGNYKLHITPSEIRIEASGAHGIFYALQTLRQIMRLDAMNNCGDEKRSWKLPAVEIEDHPTFSYRGMHLDVCRHYMPLDFVKKYIDLLAYYKMNRFHWHLTEDQGWRIEIKKYPRLQEIAAWRDQTLIGHYSETPDRYDGIRYGGYYTQEQIKEVVAYANDRGVMVIPEIEMPGHSLAALAAYPQLACQPDAFKVAQTWGVFDDVYCPREETFQFLQHVLDEVIPLFPAPYIHIGGDESPKTRWKHCAQCQARIKNEGLKDEHELQSYFIRRIEKYINAKGKQIIGWDEILEGGLAPNATVMSWRGVEGGIEAARAGHDVIMTPGSHCYFDHYQADPAVEPIAIGGLTTLEKVYGFNPIPDVLNTDEAKFILGGQANLWTEYISTPEYAEYMSYPRAIALAEALWTPDGQKNWSHFVKRLYQHTDRLDGMKVNYAKHFYDPVATYTSSSNGLKMSWKTNIAGQKIYYTRDSLALGWKKVKENESVTFDKPGPVFYKTNQSKTYRIQYSPTKSKEAKISVDQTPHTSYPGGQGVGTLNDGLHGTSHFNGRDWCAWLGDAFTLRLVFDRETKVDSIKIGLLNSPGSWIYAPEVLNAAGKIPGGRILLIDAMSVPELPDGKQKLSISANGLIFSEILLTFKPVETIPDGKPGAGQPAWTFIDEIEVY